MTGTIQDDLRKIVDQGGTGTRLGQAAGRASIPARSAISTEQTTGGAGISGPLTETSYAEREWYPVEQLVSSDGLFVIEYRRVKSISLTDSDGHSALLQLAKP